MKANTSRFTLFINEQYYPVISYDLKDYGFNSLYTLTIKLLTKQPLSPHTLLLKNASFTIQSEPDQLINGIVSVIEENGAYQDKFKYTLIIKPNLSRLKEKCRKDYYAQTDLKTVFSALFQKYRLIEISYRFKNKAIPFFLQYHQSDYDFFLTLIIQYGLIFYFDSRETYHTLIITDSPQQPNRLKQLKLCNDNAMQKPFNCAYQLHEQTCLLPDRLYIHTFDATYHYKRYATNTHNNTSFPGHGRHEISLPYACYTQAECDVYAKNIQRSIDWQRHLLQLTTHQLALCPGDIIQIEGYSDDIFRVVSLSGAGSEAHSHGFLDDASTLQSHHTLILIPINAFYLSLPLCLYEDKQIMISRFNSFLQEEGSLPQIFYHNIQNITPPPLLGNISGNDNMPAIQQNGSYPVTLEINHKKKAYNVPILQLTLNPHTHPFFGLRFPLYANTTVVIGWLNGCKQHPFILGCYPEPSAAVTAHTAAKHLIQTHSGIGLRFNEHERICQLYTQNQRAYCQWSLSPSNTGISFIHTSHNISCSAQKEISIQSLSHTVYESRTINMSIGGHAVFHAKQHYLSAINMTWQIIDTAYWQANRLVLHGQISLKARKHIHLDIKKDLNIIYKSISLHGSRLILKGYERLTINCPGIQLQFTQTGMIKINGRSLMSASTHRLSPSCVVLKPA